MGKTMTVILAVMLAIATLLIFEARDSGATDSSFSGWVLHESGAITAVGGAPDLVIAHRNSGAVSITATEDGTGAWVLWADGAITTTGTARHHGDASGIALNRPAKALSVLPGQAGYIILAEDGGIFTFGTARFYGSVPAVSQEAARNTTAVAIQLTSAGYRIVHDDGGVFSFGNAPFIGSVPGVLPGVILDQPIVAAITDGTGYAAVGGDGGVFAFGMQFVGSVGGQGRTGFVAGADTDDGYVLLSSAGAVVNFTADNTTELAVTGTGWVSVAATPTAGDTAPPSTTQAPTTTQTPTEYPHAGWCIDSNSLFDDVLTFDQEPVFHNLNCFWSGTIWYGPWPTEAAARAALEGIVACQADPATVAHIDRPGSNWACVTWGHCQFGDHMPRPSTDDRCEGRFWEGDSHEELGWCAEPEGWVRGVVRWECEITAQWQAIVPATMTDAARTPVLLAACTTFERELVSGEWRRLYVGRDGNGVITAVGCRGAAGTLNDGRPDLARPAGWCKSLTETTIENNIRSLVPCSDFRQQLGNPAMLAPEVVGDDYLGRVGWDHNLEASCEWTDTRFGKYRRHGTASGPDTGFCTAGTYNSALRYDDVGLRAPAFVADWCRDYYQLDYDYRRIGSTRDLITDEISFVPCPYVNVAPLPDLDSPQATFYKLCREFDGQPSGGYAFGVDEIPGMKCTASSARRSEITAHSWFTGGTSNPDPSLSDYAFIGVPRSFDNPISVRVTGTRQGWCQSGILDGSEWHYADSWACEDTFSTNLPAADTLGVCQDEYARRGRRVRNETFGTYATCDGDFSPASLKTSDLPTNCTTGETAVVDVLNRPVCYSQNAAAFCTTAQAVTFGSVSDCVAGTVGGTRSQADAFSECLRSSQPWLVILGVAHCDAQLASRVLSSPYPPVQLVWCFQIHIAVANNAYGLQDTPAGGCDPDEWEWLSNPYQLHECTNGGLAGQFATGPACAFRNGA